MEVKESSSEFSSSGSTTIKSESAISETTIRLGTDKISSLVLSRGRIVFVTIFLRFLTEFFEVRVMAVSTSYSMAGAYILFILLKDLVGIMIIEALSQATCIYVEKALANNQVIVANVYFAHFFLLAIVAAFISLIIYFVWLRKIDINDYLLINLVVCPFLYCCGKSMDAFLRSESRTFINVYKSTIV